MSEAAAQQPAARADLMVAMSHDGGRVLVADGEAVRFADGRVVMRGAHACAIALVEGEAWIVVDDGGGHTLRRFDAAGDPLEPALRLGRLGANLRLTATRIGVRSALIEGDRAVFVREQAVEELGERGRDRRVLIGGRGVAERSGGALVFRRTGAIALPGDLAAAAVVGGAIVFDGSAALIELERAGHRTAVVFDLRRGAVHTRIRLGEAAILAVAERKGLVVLGRGAHVALCDLRAGRCVGERILPAPVRASAIDADGIRLIVLDATGTLHTLAASMANWIAPAAVPSDPEPERGEPASLPMSVSLFEPVPASAALLEFAPPSASESPFEPISSSGALFEPASPSAPASPFEPGPSLASKVPREPEPPPAPALECELMRAPTADPDHAFLAAPPALMVDRTPAPPLTPDELAQYLQHARGLVMALCRTAQSPDARVHEQVATSRFARWDRRGAPHVELARELGLSSIASLLLHVATAPFLFGELARLYATITDDRSRPLVDEYLIAQILDADAGARTEIARELDDDAPLRRWGAIEIGPGTRPFAALTVHPVLLRRLSGVRYDGACTTRSLAELRAPRAALAGLVRDLAALSPGRPVRVVLGGRPGSGRRTIAAALAQLGGRGLGVIELPPPAPGEALEARVRQHLVDTALRGLVPCLTLDGLGDDPGARDRVRAVLDAFPGPLILRGSLGAAPPLSPGYLALELPPMSELERTGAWRDALAERGLTADPAGRLAARFAVEPGTIARVLGGTRIAAPPDPGQVEATIAASLRQHRAGRLGAIASQVPRLAGWDDLILSDDMRASLRELVGRVRCRSTVLERWGMERVASSARGITAMFQGGPGTGKTMAAGAVARALGFELWRVDLSRVMSKWLGETEKNLGAVFDAAEEGEIILLFDEADSLFGKRTEVRSSHDRYANVEVNYLLQRLDSFGGLAILTTNFGAAIDPAFRRRLSLHLQFPFPDEDERIRLWHAHLPPTLPVAGQLDLDALAHKYQMSGGYIRNATLRAAYLAAAEGTALSAVHLHHAIEAEYRDHGNIGRGGPLE